jgi:hypothetical protein
VCVTLWNQDRDYTPVLKKFKEYFKNTEISSLKIHKDKPSKELKMAWCDGQFDVVVGGEIYDVDSTFTL